MNDQRAVKLNTPDVATRHARAFLFTFPPPTVVYKHNDPHAQFQMCLSSFYLKLNKPDSNPAPLTRTPPWTVRSQRALPTEVPYGDSQPDANVPDVSVAK